MKSLTDLKPMSEEEGFEPTRLLSYGQPGTGKTIAAAHATRIADKVLWIDAEPGRKRLAFERHDIDMSKIIPVPAKDITFKSLEKLLTEIDDASLEGEQWCVVVDTITNLQAHMLTQTVDRAVSKNSNRKGEATKPHLEDYGTNTEELRRLMRQLATSNCHMVVTAHVRDQMEGQGINRRSTGVDIPAVTERFGETLFGLVDVVVFHEVVKGAYVGMVVPTSDRIAKDRVGTLPVVVPEPNFERIHQYLTGKLTARTDDVFLEFRETHRELIQKERRRAGRANVKKEAKPKPTTKPTTKTKPNTNTKPKQE